MKNDRNNNHEDSRECEEKAEKYDSLVKAIRRPHAFNLPSEHDYDQNQTWFRQNDLLLFAGENLH